MKRIILIGALIAMSTVGQMTAWSSTAEARGKCVEADIAETGDRTDKDCNNIGAGNYILIIGPQRPTRDGQWCAETEERGNGFFEDSECERFRARGNFFKVKRAPPNWHVNGVKLTQGSRSIKLQNKGMLSLKGEIAGIAVTITCGRSTSNGTIDGQGETRQGQGKSTVKYEQCSTTGTGGGTCAEPTTITTNQLKAHLATGTFQGEEQIVELFEAAPSQQTTGFAKILFLRCAGTLATLSGINAPVNGNVAALVTPRELQSQEGSLIFSESEPITKINHEGQEEIVVGLTLSGRPAKFSGFYGARLQSGETFGVYQN